MKPIIGIIMRPYLSEEKNSIFCVYDDIIKSVNKSGGIPIGILPNDDNLFETVNICHGLIFQGGDSYQKYEKVCLEYAYKNDIPTLAICLGMQHMGIIFDGKEYDVFNHKEKNKNYVHKVLIDKNSRLYEILEKEVFSVNSRHKSALKNTKLSIVGISNDGVIEAIEDKKKKFFIGVQWHPESMFNYDIISQKLFKSFVNVCKTNKN